LNKTNKKRKNSPNEEKIFHSYLIIQLKRNNKSETKRKNKGLNFFKKIYDELKTG
jgi:hypothetical protein